MAYRYIGNKTRLVPQLLTAISEVAAPGSRIADLMCGTASVSAALRSAGYMVTASDLMTFAVLHAKVRLTIRTAPTFSGLGVSGYPEVLSFLQQLPPRSGFFVREFSPDGTPTHASRPRKYLTGANAAHVDAIRAQIDDWNRSGRLSSDEITLLRHDLIMAINDIANIAGTYGHFRSSWSTSSLRPLELTPTQFGQGPTTGHTVLQGRAEDLAPLVTADLCYLDPPYMKRQYAANYHLIETIARGDEPDAVGESGLRDWWDQYSDFCSKRRIRGAFAAIFDKMDCPEFIVSYSEDGLLAYDDLVDLFSDYGAVTVSTISYSRFRSNQSSLGPTLTEYLFRISR